jgi:hypothetical protein
MFNEGRPKVHDEGQFGCPSLFTEDLRTKIDNTSGQTGVLHLIKFMRNFLKFLIL